MARAEARTKLPLDKWAALLGLNPLHFNVIYIEGRPPAICDNPWMQFPWQSGDRVGRDELAEAIAQAEADIERALGYRLLPSWEEDEWHQTIRPLRKDLFNLTSTDIRGFAQVVQANWGHFVSGGVRASTILPIDGEDAAIAWSDPDGDGYDELGTVEVTVVAGQDPCELHVYFPASNAMVGTGGLYQWEIRPINVSIVGITATITFRRELCVKPELQLDIVPDEADSHLRGVEGTDDDNFLVEVDVYRVYNDPQTQVNLLWEGLGIGCEFCNDVGCDQCEYATQQGCLTIRGDLKNSMAAYHPATWDAETASFTATALVICRQPDNVRLWYYAGLRDRSLPCTIVEMDPFWQRVVAYYTCAVLDRMVCACTNAHEFVEYWQRDMAISQDEGLRIPDSMLDNPFGTRLVAIYAWQRVKPRAMAKAAIPI